MAVQIPFPLPAAGYALNSKVRVNLDFLVDQFNQFNTGTATWDTVAVGVALSTNGAITLYNSTNQYYLTLQSGVTDSNTTYTLPTTDVAGVLLSNGSGTLSFSAGPTLSSLTTTGNVNSEGVVNAYGSFRIKNNDGFWSALTASDYAGSDLTWVLPATLGAASNIISTDGSGNLTWLGARASVALDNLANVAINDALISDTDNTDDLGSSAKNWRDLHLKGSVILQQTGVGTNYVAVQAPAAVTGSYTVALPAAAGGANTCLTDVGGNGFLSWATRITPELDNLGTTAINVSLISDTANEDDLGSSAKPWRSIYAKTSLILQETGVGTESVTIVAPAALTTSYTLTLPADDGTTDYVLSTDGAGVLSWKDVTAVGGANTTLSNLADTVAINKNLNDFSAGTITASLTGHASSDLPKTAGADEGLSGDLYLNGTRLVLKSPTYSAWKLIATPDNAITYTLTLPTTLGSTGQVLYASDGTGTLAWKTVLSSVVAADIGTEAATDGQVLTSDGAGNAAWESIPAAGATTALDNLASVAINTSLLPVNAAVISLGSSTKFFEDTHTHDLVLYDHDVGANAITVSAPAAVTSYTLTLPGTDGDANQVLTTNGLGVTSWAPVSVQDSNIDSETATDGYVLTADGAGNAAWEAAASAGATTALDNLASVAINTSLVSDTDNTDDLGSSTVAWKDVYVKGNLKVGSTSSIEFSAAAAAGIRGTNTNDSAAAGFVGEAISSFAAGASITTTATYQDITSIGLSAGDWDVSCIGYFDQVGAVQVGVGVSVNAGNTAIGLTLGDNFVFGAPPTANYDMSLAVPSYRISVAGATTIYLKVRADFPSGSSRARGRISARRVR